jgi:hypothetical protein
MKVSLAMLLKTHVEKMSASRLATMLMKTNDLNSVCHDVGDKKGSCRGLQFLRVEEAKQPFREGGEPDMASCFAAALAEWVPRGGV